MDAAAVRDYLLGLQESIASAMGALEGREFGRDPWTRAEGGGGITRILEGGELLERAGVGFSHVNGNELPPSATAHGRSSRAARGRRSACRWCSIRAILTCRPCT